MNGISIIKAMAAPGQRWPGGQGTHLRPGDRVTAKVMNIGKNGMVRLDLGRITVMAALRIPVTKGMQLPMEVVASAGQLLLKIRDQQRRRPTQPNKPHSDANRGNGPPSQRAILGDMARLDAALDKHRSLNRAMIKPLAPLDHQRQGGKPTAGEAGQPIGVAAQPTPSSDPDRLGADPYRRKSTNRIEDQHAAVSLSLCPMGDAHAHLRLTPEGLHVTLRLADEAAHRLVTEELDSLTSTLAALAPSVRVDARLEPAEPSPSSRRFRHARVSVHV